MKNKLIFALALLIGLIIQADAATRFWNPYIVSGAISGTAGVCRLTISPAITGSGLLAGDNVSVTGISGATGCNVAATISTVVDSTHIEITGTTFGGAYVSGGCVGGGEWTNGNTSNWAASSTATCGSGGSSVPGSGDTVTFDANSLAGTVVVCGPSTANCPNGSGVVTIVSLTTSAAASLTIDFNTRSPNVTLSASNANAFLDSGSGTHTITMGSGTWTISGSGGVATTLLVNLGNTNLTLTANTSVLSFTGTSGQMRMGGKTLSTMAFGAGRWEFAASNAMTGTLTLSAGALLFIDNGLTLTVTSAPTWTGTRAAPITIATTGVNITTATIALPASSTCDWGIISNITVTGNALVCTNSISYGGNMLVTINSGPSGGGGIIGE